MSNILDGIRDRAEDLRSIEENLRRGREQSGESRWPFGDMVRSTLADVKSLVARVEELGAALAKRESAADPLRSALIGILRADGYKVEEPRAPISLVLSGPFEHQLFSPDAAASDMLGEDEPDVSERDQAGSGDDEEHREAFRSAFTAPTVCKNCEQPLPPDGRCRSPYVDCQKAAAAPVVPQADLPTSAESPAAKPRQRAPEPPKLVTEWAPDGRDFEGYAKDLDCTVVTAMTLAADFKRESSALSPDKKLARWGGTFKDWAKARLTNQA